jgi:hypothetical protein
MLPRPTAFVGAVLVFLLTASLPAGATPAGPFPTITVIGPDCEPVRGIAPGGPLRITYQDVAQSCALGRCSVIHDAPLDAAGIAVRHDGLLVPGRFERTGETCGSHPVWQFSARLPGEGRLFLIDGPNAYEVLVTAPGAGPADKAPDVRPDPVHVDPPDPAGNPREERDASRHDG